MWLIPFTNAQVTISSNNVPKHYYANYEFVDDWEKIRDLFRTIRSRYDLDMDIDSNMFSELYNHFNKSFPHLTKDYKTVYEKCLLLANDLSKNYSYTNMENFMWNSCYKMLQQAVSNINASYTVKASVSSNPNGWMAPLTVTFDARNSIDPSNETIPTENFYRYYRDEKWVDRPIWQWNVINYTFEEAGKFIVHLVVRSSNVKDWILDWESDITINVTPKAANIVVYANTRRMSTKSSIKIWTSEWEKWVIFDGSATMPRWWRKILSHTWTIKNPSWSILHTETSSWAPWYTKWIVLKDNWEYSVTLTTRDNENNSVSETYKIYISDPVSVIKQTPSVWNTSTIFAFDGWASYSIKSKLNTYIWEIFDENWDKLVTEQIKKINRIFTKPWNYLIRLTITDAAAQQNVDIKDLYVESTPPTPQFTVTPTSKRKFPSEFTLDASNSTDVDVLNWVDSLEYLWMFSTENYKIISTEENNKKIVVQFNEVGKHTIKLRVTDQYGEFSTITKVIEVKSILRPEIEAIPGAITRWKTIQFKWTINEPDSVINYVWDFWDGKNINSEFATDVQHIYGQKWIYAVNLSVYDKDWNYNTVTDRVFIWEVEYPIAAYRITNNKWFYIQASDECAFSWTEWVQSAYPIDRYANFTINPGISVNTQGNSKWLQYVFEPESIIWVTQATIKSQLTHKFSQIWCHYVDLAVKDSNVWKQDKTRIWFNVKNALPTLKNVTLSFPQYGESNNTTIGFTPTTESTNGPVFDCSGTTNLTVKVTAVNPSDSDGTISRLRFYYYNVDDPDRILEYKETRMATPYAYFVIPRIWWEYKFWVIVYDNDWWMINSSDYLANNPSIYFPASCNDSDTPTVTLKSSSQNIEIWDEVMFSVVSRISSNNEDFETDRTFYYDFTWDWKRDLITKNDTAKYTFMEPYEEWIIPKAAVEYRWKLWIWDWAKIFVKNGIKPILLYNSYGNKVIFRDISLWVFQQRQICFDTNQCSMWNTKYQRRHIATTDPDKLNIKSSTEITQNDSFLWKYPDNWTYNVSLYLKNKYWIETEKTYEVKTSSNTSNWKIAPWINMITIPETTLTNWNPEIFLAENMKNMLLIYVNNENGDPCYVDTDISRDSDWDGKTDNDIDIMCNKMAKIQYQPNYESTIWRLYFNNNWQLTFKNFYITFVWYVLELDEEKHGIYDDITILINWLEDSTLWNTNLKSSLDVLRKNLNNITVVTPTIFSIKDQIKEWWIKMDSNQEELLHSILERLANPDTIIIWEDTEYEINKKEILAMIPKNHKIRSTLENWFNQFEETTNPDIRANILTGLFDLTIKDWWLDEADISSIIRPSFCSIFEYYNLTSYTNNCVFGDNGEIKPIPDTDKNNNQHKSKFPTRLKIVLIILLWWLLAMWGVIVFFSIKAKLNSSEDDEW